MKRKPQVMTWGGLRGAVGLALALSMRNLLIQQGREYTANLMAPWLSIGFPRGNANRLGLLWKYYGLLRTLGNPRSLDILGPYIDL